MAINQTNYGLKSLLSNGDYFVFFTVSHLVDWLKQSSYGTIFDTITTKTFQSSQTIFPGDKLITHFDKSVLPIMERIKSNTYQSRTLAALRDALLPELISGRLRLADAERFLQARGL
jgi:type I restriction enzyme S subunit